MKRQDFVELTDAHFDKITEINRTKGHDYAGDDDALSNFKKIAADLGLDPMQVWGVYTSKHWSSIMTFIKEGDVKSEPIEGRIHDVILYCFLLLGLIEEKKDSYIVSQDAFDLDTHTGTVSAVPDEQALIDAVEERERQSPRSILAVPDDLKVKQDISTPPPHAVVHPPSPPLRPEPVEAYPWTAREDTRNDVDPKDDHTHHLRRTREEVAAAKLRDRIEEEVTGKPPENPTPSTSENYRNA